MVNGKNGFWKSIVLQRKVWKQPGYRCNLFREGIISFQQGGNFVEIILCKYDIWLNHLLLFKDSNPNSWYSLSFEVSLKLPVMASTVLYWTVWQTGIDGLIINYIGVVEMRSDRLFIYCQEKRVWQQQVHFSYHIDPFSSLLNFFIYIIRNIKFRIKTQT